MDTKDDYDYKKAFNGVKNGFFVLPGFAFNAGHTGTRPLG